MNNIENPFLVYGYAGPEYFCDRKEETEEIMSALQNGSHLTLMSPRRFGKTGLIQNVFQHIMQNNSGIHCFYVDIYATSTLSDFVQIFAKEIIGRLDTPLQKAEGILTKIFRSSQITMSPDLLTGLPSFGLNFQPQFAKQTLEDIFTYIEQSGKRCFIAIDEFQQVLEYPEDNVEALLRTYIQKTNNARFIFSGSKQHMMSEMFNSPKHPFYRSTEKLHLNVIEESVYYKFASDKLSSKDIHISTDLFHNIYTLVDGVTWYVQAILNRIYRLNIKEVTTEDVNRSILRIIASEEEDYKKLLHLLTGNQASLLKAIAREGIAKEPLSGLFIRTHQLKSTSSVQRALQYLLDEEYVYRDDRGFMVYDRFFSIWLRM